MAKITKKQLQVLSRGEIRRLVVTGMGLATREAFSFGEAELLAWLYSKVDEFVKVDLPPLALSEVVNGQSMFRDGILDYCVGLQQYAKGEGEAPTWPPNTTEEIAVPAAEPTATIERDTLVQEIAEEIAALTGSRISSPTSDELEYASERLTEMMFGSTEGAGETLVSIQDVSLGMEYTPQTDTASATIVALRKDGQPKKKPGRPPKIKVPIELLEALTSKPEEVKEQPEFVQGRAPDSVTGPQPTLYPYVNIQQLHERIAHMEKALVFLVNKNLYPVDRVETLSEFFTLLDPHTHP